MTIQKPENNKPEQNKQENEKNIDKLINQSINADAKTTITNPEPA